MGANGGNAVMTVLRVLDRNLEKICLFVAFAACAGIVAVEVLRRYLFAEQAAWSTTIPSYMFLWLTWVGAAYAVRRRAHLCFTEVRDRLPRGAQYALLQIDYVLYAVVGGVAIYWSGDLLALQYQNESIVPGTTDVPAWWFYSATPAGWSLLLVRCVQNAIEDFSAMSSGRPLRLRASLGSVEG